MKIQDLLIARGLALHELHKIFGEFDTSGDMQLDWGEFKGALKKLGVAVPLAKMRALFSMFDEDETGQVRRRGERTAHADRGLPVWSPHASHSFIERACPRARTL